MKQELLKQWQSYKIAVENWCNENDRPIANRFLNFNSFMVWLESGLIELP